MKTAVRMRTTVSIFESPFHFSTKKLWEFKVQTFQMSQIENKNPEDLLLEFQANEIFN